MLYSLNTWAKRKKWRETIEVHSSLLLFRTTMIYACQLLHSKISLQTNSDNTQWAVNAIVRVVDGE